MTTTNGIRTKTKPTALNFGINNGDYARKQYSGEYHYRIELADGREVLLLASNITVEAGALIVTTRTPATEEDEQRCIPALSATADSTLVLALGTWLSAYMCESVFARDPWSILSLPKPEEVR